MYPHLPKSEILNDQKYRFMKCRFPETFLYVEQQFIPKKIRGFMVFRGLTQPGMAKPPKLAQIWQFLRLFSNKKVSKNLHFINLYFWSFNISAFGRSGITLLLLFSYFQAIHFFIQTNFEEQVFLKNKGHYLFLDSIENKPSKQKWEVSSARTRLKKNQADLWS